jgi:hypothetical protein
LVDFLISGGVFSINPPLQHLRSQRKHNTAKFLEESRGEEDCHSQFDLEASRSWSGDRDGVVQGNLSETKRSLIKILKWFLYEGYF